MLAAAGSGVDPSHHTYAHSSTEMLHVQWCLYHFVATFVGLHVVQLPLTHATLFNPQLHLCPATMVLHHLYRLFLCLAAVPANPHGNNRASFGCHQQIANIAACIGCARFTREDNNGTVFIFRYVFCHTFSMWFPSCAPPDFWMLEQTAACMFGFSLCIYCSCTCSTCLAIFVLDSVVKP